MKKTNERRSKYQLLADLEESLQDPEFLHSLEDLSEKGNELNKNLANGLLKVAKKHNLIRGGA